MNVGGKFSRTLSTILFHSKFYILLYYYVIITIIVVVLQCGGWVEPRALHMLAKCSITELHLQGPQSPILTFKYQFGKYTTQSWLFAPGNFKRKFHLTSVTEAETMTSL